MTKSKDKYLLVVSFLEGQNFPRRDRTKFIIEAKFEVSTLEQQIVLWEQEISKYEVEKSRPLPDSIKIATLTNGTTGPLQEWIQINGSTMQVYADLQQRYPELVSYAQADGSYKLAAAWLIDQCGWKGKALGAAAVHDKQALVLINRGGATGAEILALAERIRSDVALRFGVSLESEPVVL
jgi:UDP-N-acetylenolpyruvoylglucosamine reductase